MSAHTPGPWLVHYERDAFDSAQSILKVTQGNSYDHPQGPLSLASVNVAAFAPHTDEALANAKLISAAPDLLDALEALMQRAVKDAERYAPDGNEPIWAFISDASDAIAKAKGGAK